MSVKMKSVGETGDSLTVADNYSVTVPSGSPIASIAVAVFNDESSKSLFKAPSNTSDGKI